MDKPSINDSNILILLQKDWFEVILACDTSPYGIGTILLHRMSGRTK